MESKGIRAVQVTAETVKSNPKVYTEVRDGRYQLVYASPEIILGDGVPFAKIVLRAKSESVFVSNLICVVVDEAHVAWAWQSFRPEYCALGTLRSYYPSVPFLLLSATLALNVLGLLHTELHLSPRTRIYRVSIDRPNITQIVSPIRLPHFHALDWLFEFDAPAISIPKTMVFMDSIQESQRLVFYLRRRLAKHLQSSKAKDVVRVYSASLTWHGRVQNLAALASGRARILVCTDAAGLGVDIPDIQIVVQWKIAKHLTLAGLVQRIGRAGRDPTVKAVAVVMAEQSYFLPRVPTDATKEFDDLRSAVLANAESESETNRIIGELYFGRLSSRPTKSPTPYHKIDPALLWMLNTSGCRCRLIMAMFSDRDAFKGIRDMACCDNCAYSLANQQESGNPEGELEADNSDSIVVPDFDRCGVSMELSICFEDNEAAKARQVAQGKASKRATGPRTSPLQQRKCLETLTAWAKSEWPNQMDALNFPLMWREHVAKHAVQIRTIQDLKFTLERRKIGNSKTTLHYNRSSLKGYGDKILSLVAEALDPNNINEHPTPPDYRDRAPPPILVTPSPPPKPTAREAPPLGDGTEATQTVAATVRGAKTVVRRSAKAKPGRTVLAGTAAATEEAIQNVAPRQPRRRPLQPRQPPAAVATTL